MNPNEFGLYMIILPHEARFCTIFGKIFKENEKSQPLWLTLNDLYFALNMDFQRKTPIFAYKTSYFQFGTLKYIDVAIKYYPLPVGAFVFARPPDRLADNKPHNTSTPVTQWRRVLSSVYARICFGGVTPRNPRNSTIVRYP